MIIGIGTDLCHIPRIENTLSRFSTRLERKICSENEQYFLNLKPQHKVRRLAQMFAAKEACTKALGTGLSQGVFMKDIHLSSDPLGKPLLNLKGGALDRLLAITPFHHTPLLHLSLTDDALIAHAMVIAEALPS